MNKPPHGICLPVTYERCRDGDTPVVKLRTGQEVAVRLIDCWAPELRKDGGLEARRALESLLTSASDLTLYVPLAIDNNKNGIVDATEMLRAMTFDRVPGHLFAGDIDASAEMVRLGHATEKQGPKP